MKKYSKNKRKIAYQIIRHIALTILCILFFLILIYYLILFKIFYVSEEIIGLCILCIIFFSVSQLSKTMANSYALEEEYKLKEESNKYYDNLREKIILHIDTSNGKKITQNSDTIKEIVSNKNRDIAELMIANMKEINEYYVLSKRMTRQSFILAVSMCIGGFVIISTAVAFILINNLDAKEAIIPVISGAVIEAIAATTLIVYKKSLEQLNRYYDALHNNEIFLSSVNLVSKISTERRDQIYEYIIKTKLEDKPKQNNTEGQ